MRLAFLQRNTSDAVRRCANCTAVFRGGEGDLLRDAPPPPWGLLGAREAGEALARRGEALGAAVEALTPAGEGGPASAFCGRGAPVDPLRLRLRRP